MVYGLQGIYGLTDATIKDVRAPVLLLLGYVHAFIFFLGGSLFFPPKSHNWLYRCLIERNNYELQFFSFKLSYLTHL